MYTQQILNLLKLIRKDVFLRVFVFRRINAIIVAVAVLFTTVFSLSILASAATSFTPRLTAPSSTNKYYYSDINPFYKWGYGMPNCTAYAFGRAYEILGTEPKLSWGNAEDWYGYNKTNGYYSYGQTPKIGAVACWHYDGGGGHVAVVEKIENGQITFSNSAWNGTNFYLSYASTDDKNAGGSSWWNFDGYIYISENLQADDFSTGIYETDVDDYLNMRSGAGTSYSAIGAIPDGVKLTVTKTDGNWGYTSYNGKNGWVCLDYCVYISSAPATEPTTTQPATVAPTTAKPTQTEPATVPTTTQPATSNTSDIPDSPSESILMGDIDCDGTITVADATLLQRYLSGQAELSDEQISRCDFDSDGRISVMDCTAIQKYLTN